MPTRIVPSSEIRSHLGSKNITYLNKLEARPFEPIEPIGFRRQDLKPLTKICSRCYHLLILVTGSSLSDVKEAVGYGDGLIGVLRCVCRENCGNEYLVSLATPSDHGYAVFSCRRTFQDFVSGQADCFLCARLFDSLYAVGQLARRAENEESLHKAALAPYQDVMLSYVATWDGSRDDITLKGLSTGRLDGDPIPIELKLKNHDDTYGFFGGDDSQVLNVDKDSDMLWPFDPPSGTLGVPYPKIPLVGLCLDAVKQESKQNAGESKFQERQEGPSEASLAMCSLDGSRLSLIKAWRKNCMSDPDHKSCRNRLLRPPKSSAFPRRLIHVGSSETKPHLIETTDLPQETELSYATLSHCWGSAAITTLTTENHGSWLEEIKLDHLPRTFRDAIWLCRRLQIQYIWIDSLCIIQHSPGDEDWKREAPRMAEIYGNSSLTLAADGIDAANAGLMTPFNPILFAQISFVVSRGSQYLEDSFNTVKQLISQLHDGPLYQRAWVVQERYLSPFQVSFTKSQMVWCCKSAIAFECMPDVNFVGAVDVEFNRALATAEGVDEQWRSIIAQYSPTKCTVPHDRAIALYGLVQDFERQYERLGKPVRYCAGFWEHSLADSLAWRAVSFGRKKVENLVAPTWSWLNFQGKIEVKVESRFKALEILEVKLSPQDPSIPYGPTHGFVRLRTQIFLMQLLLKKSEISGIVLFRARNHPEDGYLWGLGPFDMDRKMNFSSSGGFVDLNVIFDERRYWQPSSEFYLVTTTTSPYLHEYKSSNGVLCEEVSEPDQGFSVPVFRRIGAWELSLTGGVKHKVQDAAQKGRDNPLLREVVII